MCLHSARITQTASVHQETTAQQELMVKTRNNNMTSAKTSKSLLMKNAKQFNRPVMCLHSARTTQIASALQQTIAQQVVTEL